MLVAIPDQHGKITTIVTTIHGDGTTPSSNTDTKHEGSRHSFECLRVFSLVTHFELGRTGFNFRNPGPPGINLTSEDLWEALPVMMQPTNRSRGCPSHEGFDPSRRVGVRVARQ